MMLAAPVVTAFTAGLLILMQMVLLFSVVRLRRGTRQSLGDGGDQDLLLAIRRHGNFAENAGIFIACFALLEMLDGGGPVFMILCAGFVLGRVSHVIGLSMQETVNPFRVGGIVLTVAVGTALGVRLITVALAQFGG